jgi:hypothetical protein
MERGLDTWERSGNSESVTECSPRFLHGGEGGNVLTDPGRHGQTNECNYEGERRMVDSREDP